MKNICADLAAEHAALDTVVADLTEEQWLQPTPAEGWNTKDTIIHLGQADWIAALAASDGDGFIATRDEMMSSGRSLDRASPADVGTMTGAELLDWWRSERSNMLTVFAALDRKARIPWFGPDMSALSFATARLMETWAHGHDVADTHGQPWPATDRLRHVAHIGVTTYGWSFVNRGLPAPTEPVHVELLAPSGETWTWGPDDAPNRVSGAAEDFCELVTQRRHLSEVTLEATGNGAQAWLEVAQAFAGPATDTRAPIS